MEILDFSSREAKADIDCLVICPAYPEYMVYGTYTIIKRGENEDIATQIRTGMLQVLPTLTDFKPGFIIGTLSPRLFEEKLPAAVLDIRFHPNDDGLFGVAMSNGTVRFYRFFKHADLMQRRWVTELFLLGQAEVAGKNEETGRVPMVTQFQWLPELFEVGRRDVSNTLTVTLAATLDTGVVKMLRTKIPAIRSAMDPRMSLKPALLEASTYTIHTHSLEAWCVALVPVHNVPNMEILLSGADDSNIHVSIFTLMDPASQSQFPTTLSSSAAIDLFSSEMPPPTTCFKGRRSHEAGVTAILPLPAPPTSKKNGASSTTVFPTPVLTGSYDNNIRLFCLSPTSHRLSNVPLASLNLVEGVWRLDVMDLYTIVVTVVEDSKVRLRYQQHYIIMASCMTAGAKILRLVIEYYRNNHGDVDWQWKCEFHKEAEFVKGHNSIVYASDFVRHWQVSEPWGGPRVGVLRRRRRRRRQVQTTETPYGTGLDGQCSSVLNDKDMDKNKNKDGNGEGTKDSSEEEENKDDKKDEVGLYTVVSTSFYDRQICNWTWKDEMRVKAVEARPKEW